MKRTEFTIDGLRVGAASAPSDTHRLRNEDALFVLPDRGFFGVFDGMGGHAYADVAARVAAEEVQDVLAPLAPDASTEAIADTLRDAFLVADRAIHSEGQVREHSRNMGTTAVVAVVRRTDEETWSSVIGWVGDSRALLLSSGARALQTLTLDDSAVRLYANSVAQARKVQAALASVTDQRQLTLQQRNLFLERHVLLQALGTALRHVHMTEHTLDDGDALLLLTDGVHDNLTDTELLTIARRAPTAHAAARGLVSAAQQRSRDREHIRAKPDDMTAIVVRLGES